MKKVTLSVVGILISIVSFAGGVGACCAKHANEMSAWDQFWNWLF